MRPPAGGAVWEGRAVSWPQRDGGRHPPESRRLTSRCRCRRCTGQIRRRRRTHDFLSTTRWRRPRTAVHRGCHMDWTALDPEKTMCCQRRQKTLLGARSPPRRLSRLIHLQHTQRTAMLPRFKSHCTGASAPPGHGVIGSITAASKANSAPAQHFPTSREYPGESPRWPVAYVFARTVRKHKRLAPSPCTRTCTPGPPYMWQHVAGPGRSLTGKKKCSVTQFRKNASGHSMCSTIGS